MLHLHLMMCYQEEKNCKECGEIFCHRSHLREHRLTEHAGPANCSDVSLQLPVIWQPKSGLDWFGMDFLLSFAGFLTQFYMHFLLSFACISLSVFWISHSFAYISYSDLHEFFT